MKKHKNGSIDFDLDEVQFDGDPLNLGEDGAKHVTLNGERYGIRFYTVTKSTYEKGINPVYNLYKCSADISEYADFSLYKSKRKCWHLWPILDNTVASKVLEAIHRKLAFKGLYPYLIEEYVSKIHLEKYIKLLNSCLEFNKIKSVDEIIKDLQKRRELD